ncbi:MAG: hypothetical protein KDD45_06685 [Bdellovibrionales bacterium]|nr:hypothetical protein [Bdellovibrionales bacterium]
MTKDNAVYTSGLGENGRLGQSSSGDTDLPTRLNFDSPIASISCGTRHSLAVTQDGAVYSWGYSGALGVEGSSSGPVKIPQEYFKGHKIISASAANDFSVALCDQGDLYAWGEGLEQLPQSTE